MANECMQRGSTSVDIREGKVKLQDTTHCHALEFLPSKPAFPSIHKDAEQLELLHVAGKDLTWDNHFGSFF